MQIKEIKIEGIKGYPAGNNVRTLSFKDEHGAGLIPNKINILVAPNGFGKSSLTIALSQLNNKVRSLEVKKEYLYLQNEALKPSIQLITTKQAPDNILIADADKDQIKEHFDIFTINSLLKAKGIGSQFGRATGRMIVGDITVCKIPVKKIFTFKFSELKAEVSSQVANLSTTIFKSELDNILKSLVDLKLLFEVLKKYNTQAKQRRLFAQVSSGSFCFASLFFEKDTGVVFKEYTEEKSTIAICYFLILALQKSQSFIKEVIEHLEYIELKNNLDLTLRELRTFEQDLKITETKGKLVVKFPNADEISNGQRDILSFLGQLFGFYANFLKSKKTQAILVIDEVFDYLDDANLLVAHYYLVNFISKVKAQNKKVYLMLLTHLDPALLLGDRFKNPKTFYLTNKSPKVNASIINCIQNRRKLEDTSFAKFLHYDLNESLDLTADFEILGLDLTLAKRVGFVSLIQNEFESYISESDYCPVSTALYLRILIEEAVYKKLNEEHKEGFISTHKTVSKLNYAESNGVQVDEVYYLLAPVYNEIAHKTSQNLYYKFENKVIRGLVKDIYEAVAN